MESVWDKAKETVGYQTYFIIWILLNSVMWPDHMYSGAELSVTDNSQTAIIYKYLKAVYTLNGHIITIYSITIENVIDHILMNVFNCFTFNLVKHLLHKVIMILFFLNDFVTF